MIFLIHVGAVEREAVGFAEGSQFFEERDGDGAGGFAGVVVEDCEHVHAIAQVVVTVEAHDVLFAGLAEGEFVETANEGDFSFAVPDGFEEIAADFGDEGTAFFREDRFFAGFATAVVTAATTLDMP